MAATPTATPRSKSSYNPTTPAASRVSATNAPPTIHASPHYATTRRHSLYGVEDRVVIDPGSRVWKVGFSGEGRPRDVFYGCGPEGTSFWKLSRGKDMADRMEEEKLLEVRLQTCLRSVFHDSLLADPKARKVIIVEHPLLPLYIKEIIARILFENQVPSVSFACSHLLSLLAVGRITGLVIDCGHLESVALPIFASRPMFPQIKTTPLAGSQLTSHLRNLLLMFASYLPPATTLNSTAVPTRRAIRVPQEILTDSIVEGIKSRCCFVGEPLKPEKEEHKTAAEVEESDTDVPPSDTSYADSEDSHHEPKSEATTALSESRSWQDDDNQMEALAAVYRRHSTTTDIEMRVAPPPSQDHGTGRGTLIIPGWVRERAAELLFAGNDIDESSLAETILDVLLNVPRDLRKTMASSILVSGGTAMLPGFIPRLHTEMVNAVAPPPRSNKHQTRPDRPDPPPYDKYGPLRPLLPYFAILNNPSPPPVASERAAANAGKAPAFAPACLAWVGGSLAGSLKTGGVEIPREHWDQEESRQVGDDDMDVSPDANAQSQGSILPDWTRTPLSAGAPPANVRLAPVA